MPKRIDIHSILIIGSGPIIIGQACEFDYAGTQACLTLKKEGYRIILVNSNPATIMTDPDLADVTYIEPLTFDFISKIIEKERPDAILATMGGQIALNLACTLETHGILKKYAVELIGTTTEVITRAENRQLFNQLISQAGLKIPQSVRVMNNVEAQLATQNIGFPLIVRSSFCLGGHGSYIVNDKEELTEKFALLSSSHQQQIITLDRALIGWQEFELEIMRDKNDNCIVVCGIENINPLGIHTGDSITVSPIMTLTDKEYQKMRAAAFTVIKVVGIESGGANVQFAINPNNGEMLIIEMNPRVSRSSALASKATGYPIAKISALLAVGYTLDELKINNQIPAAIEPVMDYVVVKMPRFNFEKFPESQDILSTKMQSIGEVMGVGKTFQVALQKAICSLEIDCYGLDTLNLSHDKLLKSLIRPHSKQLWAIADAFRVGINLNEISRLTHIHPWFLYQIEQLITHEQQIINFNLADPLTDLLLKLKRKGFSDKHIANLLHCDETKIKKIRNKYNIKQAFKRIDSCAGEFQTDIAYYYSTYEKSCEANPTKNNKIIIIGSGPNRIGQGIEFDYCCVQAINSLKKAVFETIMINSNPETVSTDYNCADRLYFSPLIAEEILAIIDTEQPNGILLQFGGQTPLNLAKQLHLSGVPLLGLTLDLIETTENRQLFNQLLDNIGISHVKCLSDLESIKNISQIIQEIGLPLIIRPSYIIGGNRIQIIRDEQSLMQHIDQKNIIIETYLDNAIEVEIDAVCDGQNIYIPAIMENIEPVGIHSGDSTCCIPPLTLSKNIQQKLQTYTRKIAFALKIVGLFNIQFAVRENQIYVLEVNPRASRTVPFISKAMGINLVHLAIQCILGQPIPPHLINNKTLPYFAIKTPVFPDDHFSNITLCPEMKSTGEIMTIAENVDQAVQKALLTQRSHSPNNPIKDDIKSLQDRFADKTFG